MLRGTHRLLVLAPTTCADTFLHNQALRYLDLAAPAYSSLCLSTCTTSRPLTDPLLSPSPAPSSTSGFRAHHHSRGLPGHGSDLTLAFRIHLQGTRAMAKSKFEYVKQFETDDPCLPNCWIVVRIDGKAFHKFTDVHHFMKPNDERGLSLMTRAAQTVMGDFNEIVIAYGQSDEYSFVFSKDCKLYNRRASKIMTNVVSLFASAFTLYWPRFFNVQELQYPPTFDARVVLYPSDENLKDYLSWRQADCHINNLYNTCFWKLVQEKGLTPGQAGDRLKGTLSSDKNELLFSQFDLNYNTLPELYRKGTVLIRPQAGGSSETVNISNNSRAHSAAFVKGKGKPACVTLHTDIISKKFWEDYPHILKSKA